MGIIKKQKYKKFQSYFLCGVFAIISGTTHAKGESKLIPFHFPLCPSMALSFLMFSASVPYQLGSNCAHREIVVERNEFINIRRPSRTCQAAATIDIGEIAPSTDGRKYAMLAK